MPSPKLTPAKELRRFEMWLSKQATRAKKETCSFEGDNNAHPCTVEGGIAYGQEIAMEQALERFREMLARYRYHFQGATAARVAQIKKRISARKGASMKKSIAVFMVALGMSLQGCEGADTGASYSVNGGTSATAPEAAAGQVLAVTALTVTRISAGPTPLIATATCNSSEVLVGGGCDCQDGANAGRMKSQIPQANGMRCECVDQGAGTYNAVAHALCMSPTFTAAVAPQ